MYTLQLKLVFELDSSVVDLPCLRPLVQSFSNSRSSVFRKDCAKNQASGYCCLLPLWKRKKNQGQGSQKCLLYWVSPAVLRAYLCVKTCLKPDHGTSMGFNHSFKDAGENLPQTYRESLHRHLTPPPCAPVQPTQARTLPSSPAHPGRHAVQTPPTTLLGPARA